MPGIDLAHAELEIHNGVTRPHALFPSKDLVAVMQGRATPQVSAQEPGHNERSWPPRQTADFQ